MRILTVTHYFEAHGGGIERVAGHLCRHIARIGATPVWAAGDGDSVPSEIGTVPLRCFNGVERLIGLPLPIVGLSGIGRLWRAVAEADAVIIHDSLYMTSIIAAVAARRWRKPVILIQHVAAIPFSSGGLRFLMRAANWLVTRTMIRGVDQVVFISATTRDAFRMVEARRMPRLLFNGVDATVFNTGQDGARAAARRDLGLASGQRLLLFVGRFVEKKGLIVIEALARRRPDLRFILAGRGPIDPARWALPNVDVARGRSGEGLAALYRAADLLLLPSVGEGYPLVIQEAMACGLPVVCGEESARADPGAAAWLTGVPILLNQPALTAERLERALDGLVDTRASDEMARYAAQTYSWDRMARALVAIFADVREPGG